MRERLINDKHGQHLIIIDKCDDDIFLKWNWRLSRGKIRSNGLQAAYLVSTNPELVKKTGKRTAYFHKLIMGDMEKKYDFIDGNTLNLQRLNIRVASFSEDGRNVKLQEREGKSSKFKGVCFCKDKGTYRAELRLSPSEKMHIGHYGTEVEAAIQYNYFAHNHFKEFARLNIIPEMEIQPIMDSKNQEISYLKKKLAKIRVVLNERV